MSICCLNMYGLFLVLCGKQCMIMISQMGVRLGGEHLLFEYVWVISGVVWKAMYDNDFTDGGEIGR